MKLTGKMAKPAQPFGRLVGLVFAIVATIAIIGKLVQGGDGSVTAAAVTVGMLLGTSAYLRGVGRWSGPSAANWRRAGWLVMAVSAAVPSSLSIVLLPIALLLVPTLLVADRPGAQALRQAHPV